MGSGDRRVSRPQGPPGTSSRSPAGPARTTSQETLLVVAGPVQHEVIEAEVGVEPHRLDHVLGREATIHRLATCSMGSASAASSICAGLWIECFCPRSATAAPRSACSPSRSESGVPGHLISIIRSIGSPHDQPSRDPRRPAGMSSSAYNSRPCRGADEAITRDRHTAPPSAAAGCDEDRHRLIGPIEDPRVHGPVVVPSKVTDSSVHSRRLEPTASRSRAKRSLKSGHLPSANRPDSDLVERLTEPTPGTPARAPGSPGSRTPARRPPGCTRKVGVSTDVPRNHRSVRAATKPSHASALGACPPVSRQWLEVVTDRHRVQPHLLGQHRVCRELTGANCPPTPCTRCGCPCPVTLPAEGSPAAYP